MMPATSDNPFQAEVQAVQSAQRRAIARARVSSGGARQAALDEAERLSRRAGDLLALALDWDEQRLAEVVQRLEFIVREEEERQSDIAGRLARLFGSLSADVGAGLSRGATTDSGRVATQGEPTVPVGRSAVEITAPPPRPRPESPVRVEPSASQAVRVRIDDEALDAMARMAAVKVGGFARHGESELRGGIAGVVDTIVNRCANPAFPGEVGLVIDQPGQFSAIGEAGSWRELDLATAAIAARVTDHVKARVRGLASEIGPATHFLNPHEASGTELESWGRFVRDNAVAVFGDDSERDVHFHGIAPGTPLTPAYVLVHDGVACAFDENGETPGGLPSHTVLRRDIVRLCREELAFFDNGAAKETADPHFKRVGRYWRSIGKSFDGRTVGSNGNRIAWSAAFISFVLAEAGASDRFPGAPGHCFYFQHFVDRPPPSLYRAVPVTGVIPRPGDIVHCGRGSTASFDFATARLTFAADGFYSSHCAIVTDIDRANAVAKTIGGNEGDSVRESTMALDGNGHLKPRRIGANTLPWIGILRMT